MLGKTNSGGGGVGGVLTVTAPAGVTVEVSKDGKTKRKTANAEGLAVFKGLATGTWTLTIKKGAQTSTKSVEITADYSAVIAFFAASISVTFPAGSTCSCSDGTTTLTAPNTSGSYTFVVPNTGRWTVSCTDGESTATKDVSIAADGQSENVELSYALYLYKAGDACTTVTGGYTTAAKNHSSGVSTNPAKPTVTNNSTNMRIQQPTNSSGVCYTAKKIDLREYDELYFDGVIYAVDDEKCWLCIWSSIGTNCLDNVVATIKSTGSSAEGVRKLNVSSLNNSSGYYIGFYLFSPDYGSSSASYVKMNNMYLK